MDGSELPPSVDSMNPVVALALSGQQTATQKANGPLPLSAEGKERMAAPQADLCGGFPEAPTVGATTEDTKWNGHLL